MELGEKLRMARLEAGMSQRQLCGEEITRNMLSQIENGTAQPSVATLRFLAGRLGKPMGYFLEEEAVTSSNSAVMESLRRAVDEQDWERSAELLNTYQEPDGVYDREMQLLRGIITLSRAERAVRTGRDRYALSLLEHEIESCYMSRELNRRRLLLMGRIAGTDLKSIVSELPGLDEELMLRAESALSEGAPDRAGALLDGAEDHSLPRWNLLRGTCYLGGGDFSNAIPCFLAAEDQYPAQAAEGLEECYRECRDFEKAYLYACKRRNQ